MIILFCERDIQIYDQDLEKVRVERRWTLVDELPTPEAARERAKLEADNASRASTSNATGRYGILNLGDEPQGMEIHRASVPETPDISLRKVSK